MTPMSPRMHPTVASMAKKVANVPVKVKLVCSECGAPGLGSCHCGQPYVSRCEEAAANPYQSVRTLAEKTGVGRGTAERALRRARTTVPVGPVQSRDGKVRHVHVRAAPAEPKIPIAQCRVVYEERKVELPFYQPKTPAPDPDVGGKPIPKQTREQAHSAFLVRASHAKELADEPCGAIATQELVDAARGAAAAWSSLADALEQELGLDTKPEQQRPRGRLH